MKHQANSLLELMDIIFFRNLNIPLKELHDLLKGTINDRKKILSDVQKKLTLQKRELERAIKLLTDKLDKATEIENLMIGNNSCTNEITFSIVESFDVFHERHYKKYLVDPSCFALVINLEKTSLIEQGIIVSKVDVRPKYILWEKKNHDKEIFAGLLKVNVEDYRINNLNELLKDNEINFVPQKIISQYLFSGEENNEIIDYYKCWVI